MGLCYLQLNQYENALNILEETISKEEAIYLDRFYLPITHYELNDYESAIAEFDKVLEEYPTFSDAQYYKSICLNYIGKPETARKVIAEGHSNFINGNSFNEDSSRYETYPYQITWQWSSAKSMLR